MTRSERLLAILELLQHQRRPVTARFLAERFAISARTVYRDVAVLNARGAVVAGEAGVGFVLRENFFLPPLAFDATEAAALLLGLRFVVRRGDPALVTAAERARGRLAALLPERFGEAMGVRQALVVAPAAGQPPAALATVREALAHERKLRLDYLDRAGRRTSRVVWPVVLGWFDGLEMLGAWCERRQAFRYFRIDRVRAAAPLDERPPRSRHALLADLRRQEPDLAL